VSDLVAIDANDLGKAYDGVDVLRGITFQVPRGSIFGLLGRNGAGKTTTIKILLGIARPSRGTARVFGFRCDVEAESIAVRRRTGFVSEEKDLYDFMTVGQMIRFTAGFYPQWRSDLERQYLRRFEVPVDRRIKGLSRGTRAKVALLLAMCRGADLLVLDEPTSGLDPAVVDEILQVLVGHVAREGLTVFFSSHDIAQIEQIADAVAILDRGRLVMTAPLEHIRESYRRIQLVFGGHAPDVTFRSPGIGTIRRNGRVMTVFSSGGSEEVVREARAAGALSVDVLPMTLKEVFLEAVAPED
jgi:ABC-2 type transport system ATP-binding protein